jgi:gliding motility-associated-like protein
MMKNFTQYKSYWLRALIMLIMIPASLSAQDLNVNVVVTDEACPGFGALSISVSNASPGTAVNYKVYLMPETNVPIWNSPNGNVPALQDGDYLVVATQTIDDVTRTGQKEATIQPLYEPLIYHVNSVNSVCGNDGSMVIEVTQGNASTYEILSGPATAGPQASNTFNNLPAGTYEIRVTDQCGNGYVSTQTFYSEQPVLALSGPSFPDSALPACNKINISYSVSLDQGPAIIYPLTVQYTVHPPGGGAPVVYNQVINTGDASGAVLTKEINYYDSAYTVDVKVTDPCGTVYTLNGGAVNQQMTASGSASVVLCEAQSLTVTASGMRPPFTVQFTASPSGFNPAAGSTGYPGPYSSSAVFGNEDNPVPLGHYEFTVTDACGRTATGDVDVDTPDTPVPNAEGVNHDCQNSLGTATISIPGSPLLTATMTQAPSGFAHPLPYDLTSSIGDSSGTLSVENLPIGDYEFSLTDACGNSYSGVELEIPAYSVLEPTYQTRPDCTEGMGTVRITGGIASVKITGAPTGYPQALPHNVSFNIDEGTFSMDGLLPGTYTFSVDTECESGFTKILEIPAFTISNNVVGEAETCSDFGVNVNYESSAADLVTFWLQVYDEDTDTWRHPSSYAIYTEGDVCTEENAYPLPNGTATTGLPFIGEFRILKMQRSYCNGSEGRSTKNCIEEMYEFEFYNELSITGIYNQTCVGNSADIRINAVGVAPLHYELISKNNDNTFYLDNANDNVFIGLESALYVVRVTDPCGDFRIEQFNVAELPPLIAANQPDDLGYCDEAGTGTGTFDLTSQNDDILGDLDEDIVIITYHTSLEDAEQGQNPLPTTYTSGNATVYARVEWTVNSLCYGLASFNLVVAQPFELEMQDRWPMCSGQPATVEADAGYVSYVWSTGAEGQQATINEPGTYTVTVTAASTCEVTKTIEVVPLETPVLASVDIQDGNATTNVVRVITEPLSYPEDYEYSLDGVNWQVEPVFTDVHSGLYTVSVRDRFGCSPAAEKDIAVLEYPKFFTPNGDGENDMWRIQFAIIEPGLTVELFDRFGRFIKNMGATSEGWDGTFEGRPLPADDYWFIIKRGDGREYKGHFSIMR